MRIAITAPTGHIGSKLVQNLLSQNADLTLLLRNPDKLPADILNQVTIQQGDQLDPAFVQKATHGVDVLFWLSPPNFAATDVRAYYDGLVTSATHAVQANHIPHVVFISSGGGGESENAGLVTHVFHTEKKLNATGANVLSLRCGFFMENFLAQLQTLREQGAFYGINSPDLKAPMVATKDIAAVAAKHLLNPTFTGAAILPVHGAADVSQTEAAQIITEATGKEVQYVQVPAEGFRQSLLGMGATPDVAAQYIEMMQAFGSGLYKAEPRTAESTTPTTLTEWVRENLKPLL